MPRTRLLVTLCALLAVLLAACAPSAPPPPNAQPAVIATAAPTAVPPTAVRTAAPTAAPATTAPTAAPAGSPVALSAPVPTNECLTGTWQVADMNAFVTSMLPIDMQLGEGLKFKGVTGRLRYTFDGDHAVTLAANAYTFNFELAVSEMPALPVQIVLNGSSSGDYMADGGSIFFSRGVPDNLKVTVTVAGQAMAADAKVANMLPLGTAEEQIFKYECGGSNLKMLPPGPTALPITLKRVGP